MSLTSSAGSFPGHSQCPAWRWDRERRAVCEASPRGKGTWAKGTWAFLGAALAWARLGPPPLPALGLSQAPPSQGVNALWRAFAFMELLLGRWESEAHGGHLPPLAPFPPFPSVSSSFKPGLAPELRNDYLLSYTINQSLASSS